MWGIYGHCEATPKRPMAVKHRAVVIKRVVSSCEYSVKNSEKRPSLGVELLKRHTKGTRPE